MSIGNRLGWVDATGVRRVAGQYIRNVNDREWHESINPPLGDWTHYKYGALIWTGCPSCHDPEPHDHETIVPANTLDGTIAERRASIEAWAAWLPSGPLQPGDSLFGVDRSAGSRTITSIDKKVGTISELPFDLDTLVRAMFNKRLRHEAERIAERPEAVDRVLDTMWVKTKPDVRAQCELEATALFDEYKLVR